MTDFHRNIYSYFRGGSETEKDCVRQLENNTTKALVNTLEHCSPYVVAKFLQTLGITTTSKVHLVQQKAALDEGTVRRKKHRILLAIVGTDKETNEAICDQLSTSPVGDSCPDAWVYGDDFVVLIESKTGDSKLVRTQMASHWQKLRPKPHQTKVITWAEIHTFFRSLANDTIDTKSEWLVEQFTQYLEWTGMTEFVGFSESMFEFFVRSDRDPDMKRSVRGAIEGLGDRVLRGKDGLKKFNKFYTAKHVGNLSKDSDHYWVAFGPEKDFRTWAHQTISLYEQKLDVFVNVELLPAIKKLRKKVKSNGFRDVMCSLPAPFTVHIEERRKTKQPRVFDYYPVADVVTGVYRRRRYGLNDTQSPGFEYIEKLLFDIEYPYLSVRRSIDRKRVLELSNPNGDALVAEVLDILKAFHPLVEFINQ